MRNTENAAQVVRTYGDNTGEEDIRAEQGNGIKQDSEMGQISDA